MRYEKQELSSRIGKENQKKLADSKITIVGIGALGTSSLELAARAGIKNIKIIDNDIIELSNLQRQTLFTEKDINKFKVEVAKKKINEINSEIKIEIFNERLNKDNVNILDSDLILDCTDNFETRFLINDYAKKNNIPWIYSSVSNSKGVIMNITNKNPCFSCIFKNQDNSENCDSNGILNTISRTISSIQVTEAIKILTNQEYSRDLIRFDIWDLNLEKIKIQKDKNCKTCNKQYIYLNKMERQFTIKSCKTKCALESVPNKTLNLDFNKLKSKFEVISSLPILVIVKVNNSEVVCYKNGKLTIRNCEDPKEAEKIAKNIYEVQK